MKLDNSNLFETLSQIRSNQYSALYTAVAKKEPQSATGTVEKPAEGGAEQTAQPITLAFDQMSRKQLSDWLSKGLDSGKIPAEQEQAFRVLLYSGKTESSDEQATTDNQAIDFTAKAKEALSSAVQRNDKSSILFWANAMATMNQFQGKEK
ncbi:MAG: hypothetical protein KJ556_04995 [Gammaproteobacteria bacterium]|nr:hypothetical protein [Gammaproteobacteria bacterium]MBU2057005.1 hypothetical protein [Gammaproteobacteria bacterium]MBU2174463.1 hypothetical protein [Gammaproteobacteria bacterium]MBU2248155.1 hypothetical protein [Gammaproteobacteria bacterium]MBU2345319.1 hypothetical protein [Gammaproteobacteria bacterium]